jgi:hypothetical protein
MSQNFLDNISSWLNGTKSPKIETVIGLEDATLMKTAGYLAGITLLFLGGLKLVLDGSLKKYGNRLGGQY